MADTWGLSRVDPKWRCGGGRIPICIIPTLPIPFLFQGPRLRDPRTSQTSTLRSASGTPWGGSNLLIPSFSPFSHTVGCACHLWVCGSPQPPLEPAASLGLQVILPEQDTARLPGVVQSRVAHLLLGILVGGSVPRHRRKKKGEATELEDTSVSRGNSTFHREQRKLKM